MLLLARANRFRVIVFLVLTKFLAVHHAYIIMEGDLPSYQLSTTLSGHQADVRTVCDLDENRVITAGLDQVAKLWDISAQPPLAESPCLQTYEGHNR